MFSSTMPLKLLKFVLRGAEIEKIVENMNPAWSKFAVCLFETGEIYLKMRFY